MTDLKDLGVIVSIEEAVSDLFCWPTQSVQFAQQQLLFKQIDVEK